tara:strand:- start:354 stop:626 length:273 start_codon:yes stop_codon:yes gene_type:complete
MGSFSSRARAPKDQVRPTAIALAPIAQAVLKPAVAPLAPGDPGWTQYIWIPAQYTMGTTLLKQGFTATKPVSDERTTYLFWFQKWKGTSE